jgi:hypothetical protein
MTPGRAAPLSPRRISLLSSLLQSSPLASFRGSEEENRWKGGARTPRVPLADSLHPGRSSSGPPSLKGTTSTEHLFPARLFACFHLFLFCFVLASSADAGDFADGVVGYVPAPGQFVNNGLYNDPSRALGPPIGGGTLAADNSKVVTLGGFGGSITLRFTSPVLDDPCNPFGLDAIVFGNAFWVGGNANRRWAEAAVIEISFDANRNGAADDAWFVIPGSHVANSPPAVVPADVIESQSWDNNPSTPTPPANIAWYPAGAPAMMTTATSGLPALFDVQVLQNPNGLSATIEGVRGYADCSPTLLLGDTNADNFVDAPTMPAEEFYTSPDNPFAVGVTPGSGGGDAFDIAWAVDALTGASADLPGFDFIRISSGVNYVAGVLGEISPEIGGVADVRPRAAFFDRTGDGAATVEDLYAWHALRGAGAASADMDGDAAIADADRRLLQRCVRRGEPGGMP